MDRQALRRPISLASITQPENHHDPPRKATGFYVDMSEDSSGGDNDVVRPAKSSSNDDKKHLFTMFIDVGSPVKSSKGHPPRLSSSMQRLNHHQELTDTSESVTLRHQSSQSRPDPRNRHSWNPSNAETSNLFTFDTEPTANNGAREESCSASVTSGDHGYQSMPAVTQPPKCVRSISVNSTNSIYSSHEDVVTMRQQQQHSNREEPSLNDTFSKDSVESFAESLSKRDSSLSDADEVTYIHMADKEDMKRRNTSFNHFKNASLTFVRKPSDPMLQLDADNHLFIEEVAQRMPIQSAGAHDKVRPHTMETLQATIERQQKLLLETVNEEVPLSSFVRLSDMDKPVARADWAAGTTTTTEHKLSRSAGSTTGNTSRNGGSKVNNNHSRFGAAMSHSLGE